MPWRSDLGLGDHVTLISSFRHAKRWAKKLFLHTVLVTDRRWAADMQMATQTPRYGASTVRHPTELMCVRGCAYTGKQCTTSVPRLMASKEAKGKGL